ncbi:MAG: citrate/2-methylcitrate synthase [Nitrospinales bacterium]
MNTIDTGLDGVPVCTSDISLTTLGADGNPILLYRGYSIFDLVKGFFEESVYLLLQGHLPSKDQFDAFTQQLNTNRSLGRRIIEHMKSYPENVHMMDFLLTTLSYARMFDEDYHNPLWQSPKSEADKLANLILKTGMRMGAKIPTIIANGYRIQSGKPVVPHNPSLNYAANFLHMLGIEPEDEAVKALNTVLILYLEHTINCSTFASLVAESSGTDPYSPLLAGGISLKGVFHGGANECTADMLEEIGKPENAEAYIHGKLERKEIVPGFGHRLKHYKDNVESRVRIAEGIARPLAKKRGQGHLFEIYDIISRIMHNEKGRTPNADLPICILLKIIGVPKTLNTPLFQASRHFGWVANNVRQRKANGPLYRPTQKYTGPGTDKIKTYVPLEKR